MPRDLTPAEIQQATELWNEGRNRAECAAELGIAVWQWDFHKQTGQLSHLPRAQGRGGGGYDRGVDIDAEPGPHEIQIIEQRRDAVRQSWDDLERIYRRGRGRLPDNYRPGRHGWAVEPARGVVRVEFTDGELR